MSLGCGRNPEWICSSYFMLLFHFCIKSLLIAIYFFLHHYLHWNCFILLRIVDDTPLTSFKFSFQITSLVKSTLCSFSTLKLIVSASSWPFVDREWREWLLSQWHWYTTIHYIYYYKAWYPLARTHLLLAQPVLLLLLFASSSNIFLSLSGSPCYRSTNCKMIWNILR